MVDSPQAVSDAQRVLFEFLSELLPVTVSMAVSTAECMTVSTAKFMTVSTAKFMTGSGNESSHRAGPSSSSSENDGVGHDADVLEVVKDDARDKLKNPPKYAVILLNDDYTTMEFVVEVLKRYFSRTEDESMQIMLRVHREGRGVAGVYSFDIAETKADQVHQLATSRGYPLKCAVEPE